MTETTSFSNNIDTLFSDLHSFVKADSVLGSPLTVQEKTIIPLMSVTLGYGSTGMGGKTQMAGSSNASAGGLGLGARVSASGVIIIDKDNVQVIPANDKSNMNQLMDKIPQAIASMGQGMMGGSSQGQQQGGSQQQGSAQNQAQAGQQPGQKSQQ